MWISILLRFSLFNFPQGSENTTNKKRTIHFIEVFCTVLKSIKTVKSSNDGNTWKSNKPLTRARNETLRSGRCCWFNVKSGKRATCKRLNVAKWKWKNGHKTKLLTLFKASTRGGRKSYRQWFFVRFMKAKVTEPQNYLFFFWFLSWLCCWKLST